MDASLQPRWTSGAARIDRPCSALVAALGERGGAINDRAYKSGSDGDNLAPARSLEAAGFAVEAHVYPRLGHGVSPEWHRGGRRVFAPR